MSFHKSSSFKTFFKEIQPCWYRNVEDDEEIIKNYFAKCFKNLLTRMQTKEGESKKAKTISKSIFSGYVNLPMLVSNRIIEAFNTERDDQGVLNKASFTNGMFNLFLGNLTQLEKLTFDIMDIGQKGQIVKEDVELLLTYLNNECNGCDTLFQVHDLKKVLDKFFHKNSINYEEYVEKIKSSDSELFFILLKLIYSKQPFTRDVIQFYKENTKKEGRENKKNSTTSLSLENICPPSKEILLPLNSKNMYQSLTFPKRKESCKNLTQFSDKIKEDDSTGTENNVTTDSNSSTPQRKFFESSLFEIFQTKKANGVCKGKVVLVDNNLFSFRLSLHRKKFILEKIHPLSGCYFTLCDEILIQSRSFYCIAIISQYGNPLANLNNLFLSNSKETLQQCLENMNYAMIGRSIDDKYEVLKQIGKGVFSTVNLGRDKLTGEDVAIKKINKNNLSQEQFEMVKQEIDIMNFLRNNPHPNIVAPIDIFEDKFFIYHVLEYMPEGTLKSYIKENNLNELEVKKIIKQIGNAVNFLNSKGIIHRDIKIENVLLQSKDLSNVKLSDFGLSTIKFSNQCAHECCGTLYYSAPELLIKNSYDRKVDIWSLGVMTYYLIFRNFPFDGNFMTRNELISKICKEKLIFHNVNKGVSKECIQFLKGSLIKNPVERFDINEVLMSDFLSIL